MIMMTRLTTYGMMLNNK